MKKLIFTLACAFALLFTTNLSAQMSVGGRIGVNIAKTTSEGGGFSVDTDSKAGLDIAAILNIGVSDLLSVQPELHFLQKGGKIEDDFFGQTVESKGTINYLEVPVHLKASFGTETIKGFALAGPSIGFGISGKSEDCSGGDCIETDIEFEEGGLKRTDFGLSLGAGVGFAVGSGQLSLDFRYLLGLANIADDDDFEQKNKGFSIGLGYMIPLGN